MQKVVIGTLAASAIAGCASSPDVTLNYYPARWNAIVSVTQTVGCSEDKQRFVINHQPKVEMVISSILDRPFQIRLKDLDGAFADADATITFTEDGRLKTINHETTGQGEAIVKAAVALVTSFGGMSATGATLIAKCDTIEKIGGGKPVTVTYRTVSDEKSLGGPEIALVPVPESAGLAKELHEHLPVPKVRLEKEPGARVPATIQQDALGEKFAMLEMQKLASVLVTISVDGGTVGTSRIIVPDKETYLLPLPKAALFGNQTFNLQLSETGAPTSIKYGKKTGATGSLSSVDALFKSQGAAAKAAELKAEADLIIQQQRLVLCQTKPDQCK